MRFTRPIKRTGVIMGFCLFTGLTGFLACRKTTVSPAAQDSTYLGRLKFVLKDNANFTDYYTALQMTGWLDTLGGPGPYTIILPDNDAYNSGYVACCAAPGLNAFQQAIGSMSLASYVAYDILKGQLPFRTLPLQANQELPSVTGGKVYVTRYLSGVDTLTTVNGQPVISLDNPASNGLIQVMRGIPNPERYSTVLQQIQSDTNLVYFAAALQRTHLDTLLRGKGVFTVLAPNNNAFRISPSLGVNLGANISSPDSILAADPLVLRNIVLNHILPGRYFLNDFRRQLTSDTLSLSMLNGEVVKFALTTVYPGLFPVGPAGPGFIGNGNWQLSQNYRQVVSITQINFCPAGGCYNQNYGDWPAGNGVVHSVNGLLLP